MIYLCLDISQQNCKYSKTNHHNFPKTPHIHRINLFMATHPISYPKKISAQKLNTADRNCVQSININFLYYAQAVDPTMLPPLNKISTYQYELTQDTMGKCNQVMDYASTNPNATILYHTSDMILMTDIYTAYLVLPESRSCIAGYY